MDDKISQNTRNLKENFLFWYSFMYLKFCFWVSWLLCSSIDINMYGQISTPLEEWTSLSLRIQEASMKYMEVLLIPSSPLVYSPCLWLFRLYFSRVREWVTLSLNSNMYSWSWCTVLLQFSLLFHSCQFYISNVLQMESIFLLQTRERSTKDRTQFNWFSQSSSIHQF